MERQLEFDFIKDMNLTDGKVCSTCRHCDFSINECNFYDIKVSPGYTCTSYEFDTDIAMKELADDAKKKFSDIMDEYKVPEHIRGEIVFQCKWFK